MDTNGHRSSQFAPIPKYDGGKIVTYVLVDMYYDLRRFKMLFHILNFDENYFQNIVNCKLRAYLSR